MASRSAAPLCQREDEVATHAREVHHSAIASLGFYALAHPATTDSQVVVPRKTTAWTDSPQACRFRP
jgi:hypothetical protein